MCKTKRGCKDCKQCFFNVSNLDIMWSSMTAPEFIYNYIWTSHKIFFSLKYLFHFFVSVVPALLYKKNFVRGSVAVQTWFKQVIFAMFQAFRF